MFPPTIFLTGMFVTRLLRRPCNRDHWLKSLSCLNGDPLDVSGAKGTHFFNQLIA